MASNLRLSAVIHRYPADTLIVDHKSAGLYYFNRYVQAGSQPENGPSVLRDIGLIKGYPHGKGIPAREKTRNDMYFQWFHGSVKVPLTITAQGFPVRKFGLYRP